MIIEKMARDLGLTPRFVENIARGASHEYKVYGIPKRSGGMRTIYHPSKRLKALQRWFLTNVVEKLPTHASATAYREGSSIWKNAKRHAASRYLLRMDLADFFPSITEQDIRRYISDNPSLFPRWSGGDITMFCQVVCRYQVLPIGALTSLPVSALTIGAPTSPSLSNAICYDLDVRLDALCTKRGVVYTRYADDLFFSCEQQNILRQLETEVTEIVSTLGLPANLRVNQSKTRHSSRRQTRRVTGIVLTSDGHVSIGRGLKRKIRALIHRFDSLDGAARASLAGMIAYATGFDPHFKNALISKYGLNRVLQAAAMPKHQPSVHRPPLTRNE